MSRIGFGVLAFHGPRYVSWPRTGQEAQGASHQPCTRPASRLIRASRLITFSQPRDPTRVPASAHWIAVKIVAAAQPAGAVKKPPPLASADPSPRSAASRSAAFCDQLLGALIGWNCENSRPE